MKTGKLSESERQRMLAALDRAMGRPPTRPAVEVDAELRDIRAARRRWGRRPAPRGPR